MTGEEEREWCGEARRILKIGRAETDTVKTGAWEAGWSGQQRSEKVERIAGKFDRLDRLCNALATAIGGLPMPLVSDLGRRLRQLEQATEELHGRPVLNNDTERDRFLLDIKTQTTFGKQLGEDVKRAIAAASSRQVQQLAWQHPATLLPGTTVTLGLLAASTDGDGALQLLHRGRPVQAVELNLGDNQKLELHAAETARCLEATLEIRLDVRRAQRVITWTPPAEIEWGAVLTAGSLGASATGEGDGGLVIDDAALQTVGPDRLLTIEAPGSKGWTGAKAEAKVTVKLAARDITWTPPTRITFGDSVTLTSLAAKVTAGTGQIKISAPVGGRFAAAGAGQDLEIRVEATEFHAAVTKTAKVEVEKVEPEIGWKEPASVVVGTRLSATQLCAKVVPTWVGKPAYEPATDTEMTAAGTRYLRATCKATKNSNRARKEVRLRVHANADLQLGYESMRDGTAWKKPTAGPAKVLADAWDDDDGSDENGIKTQGQRLMSQLTTMTSDELIDHLDGLAGAADKTSQGGTYPNDIWKFPNGLQVRYKSNGSQFNPGVPMFCIEARTSVGFSANQGDIAFKVTAEGIPAAKGPGPSDTDIPATVGDAAAQADFKSGTAQSTHLRCRPKLDQVIDWSDPAPIVVGAALSDVQLSASLTEGDGALTYDRVAGGAIATGSKLAVGDGQGLRVRAAATKRYNAAEKIVHIDVKPAT